MNEKPLRANAELRGPKKRLKESQGKLFETMNNIKAYLKEAPRWMKYEPLLRAWPAGARQRQRVLLPQELGQELAADSRTAVRDFLPKEQILMR